MCGNAIINANNYIIIDCVFGWGGVYDEIVIAVLGSIWTSLILGAIWRTCILGAI